MQTVSAAFTTQTAAAARRPVSKFEVQWNGSAWTDESAYLISHSGAVRIAQPGTGELLPIGTTNTCSVVLRNAGFRYSALASGGDSSIRSNLTGANGFTGIAARLSVGFATSNTAVTQWENASGSLKGTATAHGLEVGDAIRVQGSRLYDGRYTVTAKTANTFTVAGTYTSDTATGYVQKLEFVRAFTGVIYTATEDSAAKRVTLELRDEGYKYLQLRGTKAVSSNITVDGWIAALASDYGITSTELDASAIVIPYAWLDDDPVLQDMQTAAASAGGMLYFDHSGTLRYEEPWHWTIAPHTVSQWTFGADDAPNLIPQYSPDELLTDVVVEYAPRVPEQGQVLYTLDTPLVIRPGATEVLYARLSQPALTLYTPAAGTDYEAQTSAGVIITGSLTVATVNLGAQVRVTVINGHANMAAHVNWLQLRGVPLVGGPSKEVKVAASPAPLSYDRIRSVRGSAYMQTRAQATIAANYLAERYKQQVPTWTLPNVFGVPQLELGDRITFSDGRIVNATRDGFVIAIEWTFSDTTGYRQTIRALDAENLFVHDDYFIIGTTAIGSGKAWF